jgi:hypothetical protein
MHQFVEAVRASVATGNWHAALLLALAMPDICSKIEHPASGTSGPRYRDWFDKYLAAVNTCNIMGREVVFMTAGDCWALRCSLLHEGTDDVGEQRARETVARFRFTTLGSHRIKVEDVLVLDTACFCEEVCTAVEAWSKDVSTIPDVQRRIAGMVTIEHAAFSPHPGVRIG